MHPESVLSRRAFVRLGAGALLGSALPHLEARELGDDFRFVVLNDFHYRDARCAPWAERIVASIRAQRPAFVVLDGDLSESGERAQLGAVREIFRALPMPVHTVPGNHDCTEAGDFAEYRAHFGSQMNRRLDDLAGWQFLALDSTQGPDVFRTRVPGATLAWLDRALPSLDRARPLVVFTHFPLHRNWLQPINAADVRARLRGYNLQAVYSGHWHGISGLDLRGAHLSTSRCSSWWRNNHDGSAEKGYALCRVRDGRVRQEFVAVSRPT